MVPQIHIRFIRFFALFCALLPLLPTPALRAQERGWGQTWTQSRSDREREREEAMRQIGRAVQAKKYGEAESRLDALVRQAPRRVDVRMLQAGMHAAMRRYEAALQDCAKALALLQEQEPRALGSVYVVRAQIYNAMGKPAACRADLERAVRVDKTNAQFNNDLAWFLATSPEASVRDGQRAVNYAQTALQHSAKNDFGMLDTLAAAEAEAGNFELAARHERQALALAKGKKIRGGEKRLRLYEKHQPYREDPNLAVFSAE